ncbi:MAG: glycosyltransferase [bacterium]
MTESDSKYDLAVVMPTLNEKQHIGRVLDQIYHQDFPMERLEVVVADGGSTDGTRAAAEQFRNRFGSLKVLDNPGYGPGSGRNVGIKNSTARYVAILDGHIHIPSRMMLRDIVELFESTGAGCLCRPQPLTVPGINEFETAVALCRGSVLGHRPWSEIYSTSEGEVDPTSSGAIYERSVFEEIGYFDEDFDACEDVDFNYRLHKAGIKSYLSQRLMTYYYPRASIGALWQQMVRYGRGRARFAAKHSLISPWQWLAAIGVLGFVLMLLLSLLAAPVVAAFRTVCALYLLLVVTFSLFLALKEKQPVCLLYGPLILPTIHFGLGVGILLGWYENLFGRGPTHRL